MDTTIPTDLARKVAVAFGNYRTSLSTVKPDNEDSLCGLMADIERLRDAQGLAMLYIVNEQHLDSEKDWVNQKLSELRDKAEPKRWLVTVSITYETEVTVEAKYPEEARSMALLDSILCVPDNATDMHVIDVEKLAE